MASQAQILANRANAQKSTGPTSAEGRLISSMNGLKNCRESGISERLREDSFHFQTRKCKWMTSENPRSDMGEYLVNRTVAASCELDRAEQSHLERITSLIVNSDDAEIHEVLALGDRLFENVAGHRCVYGIIPANQSKLKKTSGTGSGTEPNDPGVLLRKLQSSEMGCTWPRNAWEGLRELLDDPNQAWRSLERLKAVRLLGSQPVQAIESYQIAEIFVAGTALESPVKKCTFEDIKSDMTASQHDTYWTRVWEKWPGLKAVKDPARAREVLISLCDAHLADLDERLATHAANSDAFIERRVTLLKVDHTPEGEKSRAYLHKCTSAFYRGVEAHQRFKAKEKAAARDERIDDEPRRVPDAGTWPQDRKRRSATAATEEVDLSWAKDLNPWVQPGDALNLPLPARVAAGEGTAWNQSIDAVPVAATPAVAQSDEAPQPSFLCGDGAEPELERDVHPAAPDTAENTTIETAEAELSTPDDGASHRPESSEKEGVEANFDETARDAQPDDTAGVMVPSDLNPALDNSCPLSSPEPQTAAVEPEHPATAERVSRRGRRAGHARSESNRSKREKEMKELQRAVEAKMKSGRRLSLSMVQDIITSRARLANSPQGEASRST